MKNEEISTESNNLENSARKTKYRFALKPTWFDAIIFGVALTVAISFLVGVNVHYNNLNKLNDDHYASFYYQNKVIYSENLSLLENEKTITFYKKDYEKFVGDITVQLNPQKGVAIKESNCKNQTCVHQGYINKVGESLVCLPNSFYVEITLENNFSDYDAVIGGLYYE